MHCENVQLEIDPLFKPILMNVGKMETHTTMINVETEKLLSNNFMFPAFVLWVHLSMWDICHIFVMFVFPISMEVLV